MACFLPGYFGLFGCFYYEPSEDPRARITATPKLMKRLLFLLSIAVLVFSADTVLACTCAPRQTAGDELKRATTVFSGKVVKIKRHREAAGIFASVEAVFKVARVWKELRRKLSACLQALYRLLVAMASRKDSPTWCMHTEMRRGDFLQAFAHERADLKTGTRTSKSLDQGKS